MRERWTDDRLDDLNKKVDDGFADTSSEFRAVRAEIGALNRTVVAMFLTMILGFAAILLQHI
jgi:tetrahydromethanopterin S-methyltransferase subunit G